jgi:putative peptidoglycan lipid II flippase
LATAILPLLSQRAATADLRALGHSLVGALRSALVVIVPFAALLPVLAPDIANVLWGHGAGRADYELYVPTLSLFGVGLVFFTVHYMMLRGFFSLELNRTVFLIQCVVAATNIVMALALVNRADPVQTSPALVLAWTASYAVGAAVSFGVLRRRLGGLEGRGLVRFLVRVCLASTLVAAATYVVAVLLRDLAPDRHWVTSAGFLAVLILFAAAAYLGSARLFGLREVGAIVRLVTHRLRRTPTS